VFPLTNTEILDAQFAFSPSLDRGLHGPNLSCSAAQLERSKSIHWRFTIDYDGTCYAFGNCAEHDGGARNDHHLAEQHADNHIARDPYDHHVSGHTHIAHDNNDHGHSGRRRSPDT